MNLKFEIQTLARNQPWILETAWKYRACLGIMRAPGRRRVVECDDEVLIEGFPRSANTFACDAFIAAQDHEIKMGNHFHSPAQFALAKKYDIPAMLVLREPIGATLSWVVFTDGKMTPGSALRNYIHFHRPLITMAGSFVIAPFDEITSNFGKSIERLNARFGTAFKPFDHSEENQREIFDIMERRLLERERSGEKGLELSRNYPSDLKRKRREELAHAFSDSRLDRLKDHARKLHEKLMALHQASREG